MRRMAFGDAERVDHEAEAAKQAEIAAEFDVPEASVAGESADAEDAAAIDTDDVVKVKLSADADVNYVRVAGFKLEPGKDVSVTRSTALLLASHDKVEVAA